MVPAGLRRVGVGPRALAARLRLPLAGAALAGLLAGAAARLAPSDLIALLAAGAVVLMIVGGLAYHLRADLARLRHRPRSHSAATTHAAERQHPAESTGPIPLAGDPARLPETDRGPLSETAPGPPREDPGPLPASTAPADSLPLYRATVESLRWDPAVTATRDSAAPSR